MQIRDIVRLVGGVAENLSPELDICGCAKMEEANSSEITFLANLKYTSQLENTEAGAILIGKDFVLENPLPVIRVEDPYMAFVTLLEQLYSRPNWQEIGISQLAYIDNSARIADNITIAPGVYIGKNVVVGSGTCILPNSVILDNAEIGEDCIIYPNVTIREDCHIGNRVILQPGCVIGGDGFGFAPTKEGFHKIPQVGNVIIEDDVEIGANSAIDRATTGSTIVCAGTKIDNLVQLAHNVKVGNHTVIAGLSGIAGSTKVGNWCQIGGQVGISGHLNISDQTKIAGNSGVMADTETGKTYFGSPVREMTQAMRIEGSLNKLPELLRRVRKLEKMLDSQKENGEERE